MAGTTEIEPGHYIVKDKLSYNTNTSKHFMTLINRGRIYSQAGNELGASSLLARNMLSMLFPYTSFLAGNELILKLTKNTASGDEINRE